MSKRAVLQTVISILVAVLVTNFPTVVLADATDVAAILIQMKQAAGGDRWDAIRTLHTVAKTTDGAKTTQTEHWEDVAVGRYAEDELTSNGVTRDGFDGVTAWTQGRSRIAYSFGDKDSALVAANESFRVASAWWFPDRHPATIDFIGVRSESGRSFDVLSVTPEGGRPFEAWIDRVTHLLARTDEQQAEDRVVTTYADYRSFQGLTIPFSIRTGDGGDASFDEVETVQSVEVNPLIPENVYSIPPKPTSDIDWPEGRNSVEVPFRVTADNKLLIPVTLNGRVRLDAELDSGGSLLLQPATVSELGVASGGRIKQGGGGEGFTTSTTGRLDSLAIGVATVHGLDFHSFAFHPDRPDEALIGLEILQRFVVRLDFDHSIMTLTKPDSFQYDGAGTIVPFHFQDNQPEVKGSVDGIAGLFTIDTGDSGSLLLIAPFARLYRLVDRYRANIPYDGKAISATHGVWARKRAGTVALFTADGRPGVSVHEPVTRISLQHSGFDANRDVSANIGLGILRQFNLTFDYPRERLIFEPNDFFGQPDIFNRSGFRLKRDEKKWTITTIYPESPATGAGLEVGDAIARISGRTPADISDEEVDKILKGPVGSRVTLDIGFPDKRRSVNLVLRDVL